VSRCQSCRPKFRRRYSTLSRSRQPVTTPVCQPALRPIVDAVREHLDHWDAVRLLPESTVRVAVRILSYVIVPIGSPSPGPMGFNRKSPVWGDRRLNGRRSTDEVQKRHRVRNVRNGLTDALLASFRKRGSSTAKGPAHEKSESTVPSYPPVVAVNDLAKSPPTIRPIWSCSVKDRFPPPLPAEGRQPRPGVHPRRHFFPLQSGQHLC